MRSSYNKNIARIDSQISEMMDYHANKRKETDEKLKNEKADAILESMRLTYVAPVKNKRLAEQTAIRNLNYKEHFTVEALTEALTRVAKESLLLNLDEYAKLNENYEDEIRGVIKGFLENADINENITNEAMISLYKEINDNTPDANLYLSEADESSIINTKILTNNTIESKLDDLSRDVKMRVANIVSKDQSKLADEQSVLDNAAKKEMDAAPLPPVEDVVPETDPYAPIQDPMSDHETQPAQYVAPEQTPVQESYKQRLNIIKEQQKTSIVETLAMNEASTMLAEGKEYNSTLALANAIKFITCLETLDASGLVSIGDEGYGKILEKSGVKQKHEPIEKKVDVMPEVKKEDALEDKISNILKGAIPAGMERTSDSTLFEPFVDWQKNNGKDKVSPEPILNEAQDLRGKYTNMQGQVFTEEELRNYFINEGFDIDLMDFESLWSSWNFVKHY